MTTDIVLTVEDWLIEWSQINMPQIRPSGLVNYQSCQRKAAAEVMKKELESMGYEFRKMLRGIGATVGTASHNGGEYAFAHWMQSGAYPKLKDIVDYSVNEFEKMAMEEICFDTFTSNLSTAQQQIKSIAGTYFTEVVSKTEPLVHNGEMIVEKRIEVDLGDGVILSGQEDLVDFKFTLSDLKTGGRDRVNIPQYGSYVILLRSAGINIAGIREDWIPRPKAGEIARYIPKVYPVKTCVISAKSAINDFKGKILKFKDKQNPAVFLANPNNDLCSAKFCPAFLTGFCEESKCKKVVDK